MKRYRQTKMITGESAGGMNPPRTLQTRVVELEDDDLPPPGYELVLISTPLTDWENADSGTISERRGVAGATVPVGGE
jgi:hypothetical protein